MEITLLNDINIGSIWVTGRVCAEKDFELYSPLEGGSALCTERSKCKPPVFGVGAVSETEALSEVRKLIVRHKCLVGRRFRSDQIHYVFLNSDYTTS